MRARLLQLPARPGFSLVEMVISLTVGGLVIGAMFATLVNMQRSYRVQRDSRTAEDVLRNVEQVLRFALQGAAADPLRVGAGALVPGTLVGGKFHTLGIKSDYIGVIDGKTDKQLEDIAVRVQADTLLVRWSAAGNWQVLAYPLRAITFEFFDEFFNPLTTVATASSAAAVAVRFTVSAPENPKSNILRSRQTWVYLQNRR